jgi:aconitate hydratase
MHDCFQARDTLKTRYGTYTIYRLEALEKAGLTRLSRLPYSLRILLEAALRQCANGLVGEEQVRQIAAWRPQQEARPAIAFLPARVIMQDFSGVPAIVDLAAMREAMARLGGDPKRVNPLLPVDLIIDHSLQVDFFAAPDALQRNAELEFQRNRERYEFLKWGQQAFANFRVVPPMTGIIHQINLEYLASVVAVRQSDDGERTAFPDSVIGTDSHTTMVNSLGVLGWGVGGIEAEAVMLGQPLDMLLPDVIGVKLYGRLRPGVTATDLVLTVTQRLRQRGVVEKFVEFYGPGVASLSLPDRAVLANMAPEYGATMGFFAVDEETLRYLRLTGRPEEQVELVERYCRAQGLFREATSPEPEFTDVLELDLDSVEPSLAGPKRPQDRVPLVEMKRSFQQALTASPKEGGYGLTASDLDRRATIGVNGGSYAIGHGAVVIAAITSCTNTSNPALLMAAGLLARKAVARGLQTPPHVKTSLAPGSRVVTEYLRAAGLLEPLNRLGFHVVGYGCTTCIGNSGPLPGEVARAIVEEKLVAAAVISGNRNFEGRVHPLVKANYLASPPLVVAYALAGRVDIDLENEPLGYDRQGAPVFLRDLWPEPEEIQAAIAAHLKSDLFREKYADVFRGSDMWQAIPVGAGDLFQWDETSTYIHCPPFFEGLTLDLPPLGEIRGARVLAVFGDSVTTDHISPAGSIPADSPAGQFLQERGVLPKDFNQYGARRGNDQVLTRGTFANIRLKNLLVAPREGGYTIYLPAGEEMTIFDAAMRYKADGTPVIILAGKEYGTGSSRDWAAKGPMLLGVRAVIAESFERIHRSNLVGMGILPLRFLNGENAASLGLDGREVYDIEGLRADMPPQAILTVRATRADGTCREFPVQALLNTEAEVNYYRNGGILPAVLRSLLQSSSRR